MAIPFPGYRVFRIRVCTFNWRKISILSTVFPVDGVSILKRVRLCEFLLYINIRKENRIWITHFVLFTEPSLHTQRYAPLPLIQYKRFLSPSLLKRVFLTHPLSDQHWKSEFANAEVKMFINKGSSPFDSRKRCPGQLLEDGFSHELIILLFSNILFLFYWYSRRECFVCWSPINTFRWLPV